MNFGIVALLLMVLTGCSTNRGTNINYVKMLNSTSTCTSQVRLENKKEIRLNQPIFVNVGNDNHCFEFKSGKSFYKLFKSESPFTSVTLRSFYGISGDTAKLFFPEVAAYNTRTSVITESVTEEIIDKSSSKDGHYLEITYSFATPQKHVVVYTDSSQFQQTYNYSSKNTVAFFMGSAVVPLEYTHQYGITYNAGGPVEIIVK